VAQSPSSQAMRTIFKPGPASFGLGLRFKFKFCINFLIHFKFPKFIEI
jgi:hypothetical protein